MMSLAQTWTMRLAALLAHIMDIDDNLDVVVEGISLDSRKVQPGDCFVAIKGNRADGTQFIAQAVERGAVAVLIDRLEGPSSELAVPVIRVDHLSKRVSDIAGIFYGQPSQQMALTAITGTNGKTTCSRLFAELIGKLASHDAVAGFIGTNGYGVVGNQSSQVPRAESAADAVAETVLTTPDAVSMQRILAELASKGATHVGLEVSSHGLAQYRIDGLTINTAVFTNLSRDHLDYHLDIHAYAAAKARLFSLSGLRNAVINIDDPMSKIMLSSLDAQVNIVTFSLQNSAADIHCSAIQLSAEGLQASIVTPWGQAKLVSPLLGRFNLANLLAVLGAAAVQGVSLMDILGTIPALRAVPGRMELVDAQAEPAVVVDYAHTPDALEKALQALQMHCAGNLWVVFGCGGDRDIGKRAEMGEIAARCADTVVVTSDNPRTESPQQIIEHILQGISCQVIVEPDRRAAIRRAIFEADKDDVLLIAGKGHEDYQILGAQRLPFSDQVEARLALGERRAPDSTAVKGGEA